MAKKEISYRDSIWIKAVLIFMGACALGLFGAIISLIGFEFFYKIKD